MQVQYDSLISKSDSLNDKYQRQVSSLNQISQKMSENATNQELVKKKMMETEVASNKVHMSVGNIGKSIKSNIAKVGKWALAIFSVRSAYMAIRQAMSTLTQYNEELAKKLEAIQLIVASALEPIINVIVNLVYKLAVGLAQILQTWFGIDVMSRANELSMKKNAGYAKEMRKQLAGFDEMNILADNTKTNDGGGLPKEDFNLDLSKLDSALDSIKKKMNDVLAGIKQNVKKVLTNIGASPEFIKGWELYFDGLVGIINGSFDIITGTVEMFLGLITGDTELFKQGITRILNGLVEFVVGIVKLPIGSIMMLVAGVKDLVSWIGNATFDDIRDSALSATDSIKSLEQSEKDLKLATEELQQAEELYINAVKRAEQAEAELQTAQEETGISIDSLLQKMADENLNYKDLDANQRRVYESYIKNKGAQENLTKSTDELTESQKKQKDATWEQKLAVAKNSDEFDEFKKSVVEAMNDGSLKTEEARDLMEKAMSGMSTKGRETFMKDLPNDIKNGLDKNKYSTNLNQFTRGFFDAFDSIRTKAGEIWGSIKSFFGFGSGGITFSASTSGKFAKGGIVYPKLQRLATGGIINQPGRGVPLTQAIGGERGQEGILPLTDSQQMDLLGQSIARHMTINLTNVNQMNGRTISRELKKINAVEDFAMNR